MKRGVLFLVFLVTVMLIASGCSKTEATEDLFEYKGSYVGDNSAVGSIVKQLEGEKDFKEMELKTEEEPYGIVLYYDLEDAKDEEVVFYNATFLFTLVDNVDWVSFELGEKTYEVTKEGLKDWYGEDFTTLKSKKEVEKLLEKHGSDEKKMEEFLR